MSDKAAFSKAQLADWRAYERVRAGGRFNMYDPRARKATGLNAQHYSFVMEHFSELRAEPERISKP